MKAEARITAHKTRSGLVEFFLSVELIVAAPFRVFILSGTPRDPVVLALPTESKKGADQARVPLNKQYGKNLSQLRDFVHLHVPARLLETLGNTPTDPVRPASDNRYLLRHVIGNRHLSALRHHVYTLRNIIACGCVVRWNRTSKVQVYIPK